MHHIMVDVQGGDSKGKLPMLHTHLPNTLVLSIVQSDRDHNSSHSVLNNNHLSPKKIVHKYYCTRYNPIQSDLTSYCHNGMVGAPASLGRSFTDINLQHNKINTDMHNHSVHTNRHSNKHPTLASKTNYAYPFTTTPRFPSPNPPYVCIHAAAPRPSTATHRNSPTAKQAWATARRLIFRSYSPTTLHPIDTRSSLSSRGSAPEASVSGVRGRDRPIDRI